MKKLILVLTIFVMLFVVGCSKPNEQEVKNFETTEYGEFGNISIVGENADFKVEVQNGTILRITIFSTKYSMSASENEEGLVLVVDRENKFSEPDIYEYQYIENKFYEIAIEA